MLETHKTIVCTAKKIRYWPKVAVVFRNVQNVHVYP